MPFEPFTWAAGFVLTTGAKAAFDHVKETFFEEELNDALVKAASEWARELPGELSIHHQALLRPLTDDERNAPNPRAWPATAQLGAALAEPRVPSSAEWYSALAEQRRGRSRELGRTAAAFFTVEDSRVEPHLRELARRLYQVCATDEALFRLTSLARLDALHAKVDALGAIPAPMPKRHLADGRMLEVVHMPLPPTSEREVMNTIFSKDLVVGIHRRYAERGHARFRGLWQVGRRALGESDGFDFYALTAPDAVLLAAIRSSFVRQLNRADPETSRDVSRQVHAEFVRLVDDGWVMDLQLPSKPYGTYVCEFDYDLETRHVAARTLVANAGNALRLPKEPSTSELLSFAGMLLNAPGPNLLINFENAQSSAMVHFALDVVQSQAVHLERVRISRSDPEVWDYPDP